MSRLRKTMLAVLIVALACSPVTHVQADAVGEKPYISLGADLSGTQRSQVLALLGVTEEDLSGYEVMEITNEDEHEYLDDYLSASVIGSKALSSVRIEKLEEGQGIGVETKNINYCTSGMYTNALTTAGITDARVIVAGPFEISGTAALVGAMKAYSTMTGEALKDANADAATNELVLTGELGQAIGQEKAEELVALAKQRILDGELDSPEEIEEAIVDASNELGVNLSEEQKQKLSGLMDKISDLDLDVDKIKQQAEQVYDKLKELDIDIDQARGIFQKIVDFFAALAEKIASWFSGLFG